MPAAEGGHPTTEKDIYALMSELTGAMAEHQDATEEASRAGSRVTAATNRLNAAQKAIDAHVAALKKKAPWNTDWHTKRGLPEALP